MIDPLVFTGAEGTIHVSRASAEEPTFVVLLAHGYGEHAGRYEHVAQRLVDAGADVYAPDHLGHGLSTGERALIVDFAHLVDDFGLVDAQAREDHPDLPVVALGHSLGGLVVTRYAQREPGLDAIVLSAPFIGENPDIAALLTMDPLPEVPIDPAILSRDPAVGEAYAADPLVYSGPFQRTTLEQTFGTIDHVKAGPGFLDVPTLWLHGEDDGLANIERVRETIGGLRGTAFQERSYAGARHEIFNETNKEEVLDDVVAFLRGVLGDGVVQG